MARHEKVAKKKKELKVCTGRNVAYIDVFVGPSQSVSTCSGCVMLSARWTEPVESCMD